jgi:two-component system, OmpR family, sensor kinase
VIGRLSLKARLILGVIVLAGVGLAAADVATYASLHSFLIQRTDQSLQDNHPDLANVVGNCQGGGGGGPPGGGHGGPPGNTFARLQAPNGQVCSVAPQTLSGTTPSPPKWPSTSGLGFGDDNAKYFTVSSQDGKSRYRVRAELERAGGVLLTAASLSDVDATLRRLLVIELLVTASVLLGIVALGVWVVRLGLRPLTAIEATAAAIAAGDLSRRVERAEPNTEVGRLGMALNTMLTQIQTAFNATAASEARLRRFVADASHELRTPLAAVRAYAELFGRGANSRPDDLERSMTGIERESRRMSLLVDDLLLLARLDEGRPLEHQPVGLAELVAEAVETATTLEPGRPIELSTEEAVVDGDHDRLRQVVDNLLANVRAHTPPGAPATVRVLRSGASAVIEVEDTGPGMEPEQAARMFERFYRADPARARARGGTGLGLSIVAAVAEAHGGSATAVCEPGAGTTVRVTLPLAATTEDAPNAPPLIHTTT